MFPNHITKEKSKIEIEICLFKILYMRFKPLSKELMQNEWNYNRKNADELN